MKASLYYQDLGLNSCNFGKNEKLRLDTLHASFIGEIVLGGVKDKTDFVDGGIKDKIDFADEIYRILNTEPETLFTQEKFKEIGHTSMSIGDYFYFEEMNIQTILICASAGWEIVDDEFLKRRDKVIDTIYTLPLGVLEEMNKSIEAGDKRVVDVLVANFDSNKDNLPA